MGQEPGRVGTRVGVTSVRRDKCILVTEYEIIGTKQAMENNIGQRLIRNYLTLGKSTSPRNTSDEQK